MDAILAPWPGDCLPFGSSIDMWRRALAPRFHQDARLSCAVLFRNPVPAELSSVEGEGDDGEM
jgi:hypothetical protein